MYKTICDRWPKNPNVSERTRRMELLTRMIDGTLYDVLPYPFHQEKLEGTDKYILLRDRRPSVRYALCRLVIDDSVSLLFSDGHFPTVYSADESVRDALALMIAETELNRVMIDAATHGAIGSVCILMRILSNRVFFDVMPTLNLMPFWSETEPDVLYRVRERRIVKGEDLEECGYTIARDDLKAHFWFEREWNVQFETWYLPRKVSEDGEPVIDQSRTVKHGLGFVPMVWIKNLPGGQGIDGPCTFPVEAIDTQIEIDYQLSQCGRGLKYSSDPTLLIKEPVAEGSMVRGAANAIIVAEGGDARMLEISGSAADAVLGYVRTLRELALEYLHGNRVNADRLTAAQSGRAMELMNESLIRLSDRLRINYGAGLLKLCSMVVKASHKFKLNINRVVVENLKETNLSLRWPAWYQPTYQDAQIQGVTVLQLVAGGLMSQSTALHVLAQTYDIADPADEKRRIDADLKTLPQPEPTHGKQPTRKPTKQPANPADVTA
jgi:hypothetical protein